MKNKFKSLLFTAVISLVAWTASAQTNADVTTTATNVLTGAGASPQTVAAVGGMLGWLVDAEPFVKNGDVLFEIGALKSGSKMGGFFDLQMPVSTNSWQVTYGLAGAFVDHALYSGSLNVGLGKQVSIPLLSKLIGPVYLFAESGPGYNLKQHQFVVQSFAGLKLSYQINPKWGVLGSYGYGIISDVKERQQEFSLGCTYKFGK